MSVLVLIGSCQRIDTEIMPQAEQRPLMIEVADETPTKAPVTGTAFSSGAEIGIQLTDGSGTYDGKDYRNVKYTMNGSQWNTASDVFLSNTAGTLYGYYPYSSSVTDLTSVPVSVSSQTDYMYAAPVSGLKMENRSATLSMKHALTVVRLNFVKEDYSGTGAVTSVSVSSPGLATSATLDATTGRLSGFGGTGSTYTSAESFTISETATTRDYLMVPTGNAGTLTITLTIDGNEKSVTSESVTMGQNYIHEYTITIDKKLTIDDLPDVAIQHIDGTLYTAEEWLAAEEAGTVTDADANGVFVKKSSYAICPHVIHPNYSTSNMKWSSTYVTVPGVYTTKIENYTNDNSYVYDVAGKANTDAILAAVSAGTIADAPAAQWASQVLFANGSQGYLPAAGEVAAWTDNKTAINACMDAIGGDQVLVNTWDQTWTSTQYSSSWSWRIRSEHTSIYGNSKTNPNYVRAVCAFSI